MPSQETVRAALLRVARNVAKHLVSRDGWSEDDSCFQIDLRDAEGELLEHFQRQDEELKRLRAIVEELDLVKPSPEDGTHKLCTILYGSVQPRHYLGGSDARMLHDAARTIQKQISEISRLVSTLSPFAIFLPEHWEDDTPVGFAPVIGYGRKLQPIGHATCYEGVPTCKDYRAAVAVLEVVLGLNKPTSQLENKRE